VQTAVRRTVVRVLFFVCFLEAKPKTPVDFFATGRGVIL
jgi:hypothetical protein